MGPQTVVLSCFQWSAHPRRVSQNPEVELRVTSLWVWTSQLGTERPGQWEVGSGLGGLCPQAILTWEVKCSKARRRALAERAAAPAAGIAGALAVPPPHPPRPLLPELPTTVWTQGRKQIRAQSPPNSS